MNYNSSVSKVEGSKQQLTQLTGRTTAYCAELSRSARLLLLPTGREVAKGERLMMKSGQGGLVCPFKMWIEDNACP